MELFIKAKYFQYLIGGYLKCIAWSNKIILSHCNLTQIDMSKASLIKALYGCHQNIAKWHALQRADQAITLGIIICA